MHVTPAIGLQQLCMQLLHGLQQLCLHHRHEQIPGWPLMLIPDLKCAVITPQFYCVQMTCCCLAGKPLIQSHRSCAYICEVDLTWINASSHPAIYMEFKCKLNQTKKITWNDESSHPDRYQSICEEPALCNALQLRVKRNTVNTAMCNLHQSPATHSPAVHSPATPSCV